MPDVDTASLPFRPASASSDMPIGPSVAPARNWRTTGMSELNMFSLVSKRTRFRR